MSDLTPAEELREAAWLMRERAKAATAGPWRPVAGIYGDETFAAVIGPGGIAGDAETWLMATGRGGASQDTDADHVAGMHPGVALAVADWLDSLREAIDWSEDDLVPSEFSSALKVARVYLGADAPGMRSQHQEGSSDG